MSGKALGGFMMIAVLSLILFVGSCEPEPEICSHWTLIDKHRVSAGTHACNLGGQGVSSLKAERITLRLYGHCPIDCNLDPYLIQATQQIAAEEKGL